MFEIIDHKDFATVRLMDGGSQMQFGVKQDWNDFQTFEARALIVCYVCEIILVYLVWKYLLKYFKYE